MCVESCREETRGPAALPESPAGALSVKARCVRHYSGGWIMPASVALFMTIAAAVWLFWLLVIGVALVVG
jgi:hypothetical protein